MNERIRSKVLERNYGKSRCISERIVRSFGLVPKQSCEGQKAEHLGASAGRARMSEVTYRLFLLSIHAPRIRMSKYYIIPKLFWCLYTTYTPH